MDLYSIKDNFEFDPSCTLITEEQIAWLIAEAERLQGDYENACKTIAEMHMAAVGEITGPKRGVVEDVVDLRREKIDLESKLCGMRGLIEQAHKYIHFVKGWSTHGPASICTE